MNALKTQYFFGFAVMGALLPYLPLYLEARGLSDKQVGLVVSTTGLAVLLTPVLMTAVADAFADARRLLAIIFASTALLLATFAMAEQFIALLVVHLLYALAFAPTMPLLDGLYFSRQHRREALGQPTPPYHRVRVWGTLGYIGPGVALYGVIAWWGGGAVSAIGLAAAVAVAALVNTVRLPRASPGGNSAGAGVPSPRGGRLPTLAAGRAMLRPRVLGFCAALWLVHLAAAGFYGFYPQYLTRTVGIDAAWVGLISSLGVVIEVFFMLAFGFFVRRFGLRTLMAAATASIALRLALLAMFPIPIVAVGTQVLHGLTVLVVHVAPPVYLNRHAEPAYRHSMQGLYAMTIYGSGRVVGAIAGGYLADASLLWVFWFGAAMCAAATLIFAAALRGE